MQTYIDQSRYSTAQEKSLHPMRKIRNYSDYILNELNRETYLSAADKLKDKSPYGAEELKQHSYRMEMMKIAQRVQDRPFMTPKLRHLELQIEWQMKDDTEQWAHCKPYGRLRESEGKERMFRILSPDITYSVDKDEKEITIYGDFLLVHYSEKCSLIEEEELNEVKVPLLPRNEAMYLFKHAEGNADTWRELWNGEYNVY